MVDAVMDDAQDTWRQLLGGRYQDTKAVLFRDAINSACGFAQSATGPFYCPADHKVYLDLGFFDEMQRKLGAPGDFAQAYVLAHELGHHVQTLIGTEAQVRQRSRPIPARNALSVRHGAPGRLLCRRLGLSRQPGRHRRCSSIRMTPTKALNAAAAIGDDRLQRMQTGRVAPDASPTALAAARRVVPPRHVERRSERLQYVSVDVTPWVFSQRERALGGRGRRGRGHSPAGPCTILA